MSRRFALAAIFVACSFASASAEEPKPSPPELATPRRYYDKALEQIREKVHEQLEKSTAFATKANDEDAIARLKFEGDEFDAKGILPSSFATIGYEA